MVINTFQNPLKNIQINNFAGWIKHPVKGLSMLYKVIDRRDYYENIYAVMDEVVEMSEHGTSGKRTRFRYFNGTQFRYDKFRKSNL